MTKKGCGNRIRVILHPNNKGYYHLYCGDKNKAGKVLLCEDCEDK